MLDLVVGKLQELLPSEIFAIRLLQDDGKTLKLVAQRGLSASWVSREAFHEVGVGVSGLVAQTLKPAKYLE